MKLKPFILIASLSPLFAFSCIAQEESEIKKYSFTYAFDINSTSIDTEELVPKNDFFREPGSTLLTESGTLNGFNFYIAERYKWVSGRLHINYLTGELDYSGTSQSNQAFTTLSDYDFRDFKLEFGLHGNFFNFSQNLYLGYGKLIVDRLVKPAETIAGLDESYEFKYPSMTIDLNKTFIDRWQIGFSYENTSDSKPMVEVFIVPTNPENANTKLGDVETGKMTTDISTVYAAYKINNKVSAKLSYKIIDRELEEGEEQEFPIEGSNSKNLITQPAFIFEQSQINLGVVYEF